MGVGTRMSLKQTRGRPLPCGHEASGQGKRPARPRAAGYREHCPTAAPERQALGHGTPTGGDGRPSALAPPPPAAPASAAMLSMGPFPATRATVLSGQRWVKNQTFLLLCLLSERVAAADDSPPTSASKVRGSRTGCQGQGRKRPRGSGQETREADRDSRLPVHLGQSHRSHHVRTRSPGA